MMVNLPATYLEPGVVQAHASPIRGFMDLGRYPNGADPLCESIADDLNRATFRVQVEPQVMRWKYAKLLTNLANALQAACGPEADVRELDAKLRAEGVACFQAAGIEWASTDEMHERHGGLEFRPIDGRDREGGSSWQSLARSAGSIEADYLNGEIALMGRLHGVPTPLNRALQEIAGRMARQRRQPGTMTVDEMREALGVG
jgi:2-dehydropantoate 2-reductase